MEVNLSILREKPHPHSYIPVLPCYIIRKMEFLEQFLRSVEACENRTTEHRYIRKYSTRICGTFYFQCIASSSRKIFVKDARKLKHLQLRQQRQPSLKELRTSAVPHSSIKPTSDSEKLSVWISLLTHHIRTDTHS